MNILLAWKVDFINGSRTESRGLDFLHSSSIAFLCRSILQASSTGASSTLAGYLRKRTSFGVTLWGLAGLSCSPELRAFFLACFSGFKCSQSFYQPMISAWDYSRRENTLIQKIANTEKNSPLNAEQKLSGIPWSSNQSMSSSTVMVSMFAAGASCSGELIFAFSIAFHSPKWGSDADLEAWKLQEVDCQLWQNYG